MPSTTATSHPRRSSRVASATVLCGALAGLCLAPGEATAQSSAREVIQEALEHHRQRAAGIEGYTVVQEVMGRTLEARFEKETRDGYPVFVQVGSEALDGPGGAGAMPGAPGAGGGGQPGAAADEAGGGDAPAGGPPVGGGAPAAGAGPGLDADGLRDQLLQAAAGAGLEAVAEEIAGASDGQVAGLLGALGQSLGQGGPGGAGDFEDALLDAAKQAGMQGLTSALSDVAGPEVGQLASALQRGGLGSAVEQLGALAAQKGVQALMQNALPDLLGGGGVAGAAGSLVGGGDGLPGMAGGMPGMPGGGGMGGPQGQLLTAAATAGMGALVGAGMQSLMGGGAATPSAPGSNMDPVELLRMLADDARLAGTETVDGHEVWTLVVDDPMATPLGEAFSAGGADDFAPGALTVHLDRQDYVLRQLSMEGTLVTEGKELEMAFRTLLEDYRQVDGLLHPFRTVVVVEGMGNMLSDEEREELREAREQMEKMEEELAQLPPQQRAMAERMMKQKMPQIQQQMEAMAAAEPMEITTVVQELTVERVEEAGGKEDGS